MQLGELQHQFERFEQRGVSIVAISVDAPSASLGLIERLGLRFDLASDPAQAIVKAFGVQNPDTKELAIHAVYLIDRDARVFYRKVGRRRPVSQELIDAIDAFRGDYPRTDEHVQPRQRINVAYPQNNFQALITLARVDAAPKSVDITGLNRVLDLVRDGRSDDSTIAFKRLMEASSRADRDALHAAAAWLVRQRFFHDTPAAIDAGRLLARRLGRVDELEAALAAVTDDNSKDAIRQDLARARAGLSVSRADVEKNAASWNLRYAKASLRSYREVANAAMAAR